MISTAWLIFAATFALSLAGTAVLIRLAPHLGLIDLPAERKVHTRPTPKGGGLAIFFAVACGCLAKAESPHSLIVLALGALLVVLGLVDDLRPLPWQLRLFAHFAAAVSATLAFGPDLSNPSPTVGLLRTLVMVFWIVAMINAFNMLDNMDALSAGVALIAAGFLGAVVLQITAGDRVVAAVMPYLALVAALAGFLVFNRPPARIFMGDAGSTFLGFFLGVGSVRLFFPEHGFSSRGNDGPIDVRRGLPPWGWAVVLAVLAVPCYDMASVILLRLKQGRSPFHADKQHLSHRLVERGLSKPNAVAFILLLAIASGAAGLALLHVDDPVVAGLIGASLVVWWLALAIVEWKTVRVADTSPRQAGGYTKPENPSAKESSHEPPT